MKYKIGDKVRVRKDLKFNLNYGDDVFVTGMEKFKGKIVTINHITNEKYCIMEDKNKYSWTDEMFEGLYQFTKSDLRRGDIVIDEEGNTSVFDGEELIGATADIDYLDEFLESDSEGCSIVKVERPVKLETIWVRNNELTEMTIEEIENKLGLASGSLRIKKED